MKNCVLLFMLFLTLSSCKKTKVLDLKAFTIEIPQNWHYLPEKGEDSFVGEIKLPSGELYFDCSTQGYANHLILSEQQYLAITRYYLTQFPNQKPNIESISGSIMYDDIAEGRLKHHISDTTVVISSKSSDNLKTDYLATVKTHREILKVPITIPAGIKNHVIIIDTVGRSFRKIVYPKVAGKGTTGIYLGRLNSRSNLQISGIDLPIKDQQAALTAFKTIKFKE